MPTAPVIVADTKTDVDDVDDFGGKPVYNADGIMALPKQELMWPSAMSSLSADDDMSSKVDDDGAVVYQQQNNVPWLPQVYADPNGGW